MESGEPVGPISRVLGPVSPGEPTRAGIELVSSEGKKELTAKIPVSRQPKITRERAEGI